MKKAKTSLLGLSKRLGIPRTTLRRRLEAAGIDPSHPDAETIGATAPARLTPAGLDRLRAESAIRRERLAAIRLESLPADLVEKFIGDLIVGWIHQLDNLFLRIVPQLPGASNPEAVRELFAREMAPLHLDADAIMQQLRDQAADAVGAPTTCDTATKLLT